MVFIFEKVDANGIKYNARNKVSCGSTIIKVITIRVLTQSNLSTKITSETVSVIQIHEEVFRTKLMS